MFPARDCSLAAAGQRDAAIRVTAAIPNPQPPHPPFRRQIWDQRKHCRRVHPSGAFGTKFDAVVWPAITAM